MTARLTPDADLLARLRPLTGAITAVTPTHRQYSTDLTATVDAAQGRFFIKAMRNRPGGRRDQMLRERSINPAVRAFAPELLWSFEDEEWIVLGFAHVEARAADFEPGSPDLPVIMELVRRIGELPLPEVAREWRETRLDWWADRDAPELFRGDSLLYVDFHPANILIGPERPWVVDWSWPTRGAAFIDPAVLVPQLIAAHHSPAEAEAWAARCPAWTEADPEAVDAFAVASARMARHRALREPGRPWRSAMADAVQLWAAHRGITNPY